MIARQKSKATKGKTSSKEIIKCLEVLEQVEGACDPVVGLEVAVLEAVASDRAAGGVSAHHHRSVDGVQDGPFLTGQQDSADITVTAVGMDHRGTEDVTATGVIDQPRAVQSSR